MDEDWLNPAEGPSETEVAIDYIKSPDFKIVWVDGLIGSATPTGLINNSIDC